MHGRPRLSAARPLPSVLLALLALLVLSLTACSQAAQPVRARLPVDASAPACVTAADRLPGRLLGQSRRSTSPTSPALAAWGDPAIILRCGVESPGASTEHCETVNGIDWVVQPLDDGEEFTTFGRTPAIQVLVPKHYAPEEFALTALAPAAGAIAQGSQHCT